eukprot:1540663-Amphidinium_carterae.1
MHLHHGSTWYPLQRANQIWADEELTADQRRSLLEQNHRQAARTWAHIQRRDIIAPSVQSLFEVSEVIGMPLPLVFRDSSLTRS